jgi:intein-encoded DNA endonuclease-like protein
VVRKNRFLAEARSSQRKPFPEEHFREFFLCALAPPNELTLETMIS